MNIISKLIEAIRIKRNLKFAQRQQETMKRIDEHMKRIDPDAYNVANKMADIATGGDGFLIFGTRLKGDELNHEVIISKGFKLGDVSPAIDECKKLAEKMVEEKLKEKEDKV